MVAREFDKKKHRITLSELVHTKKHLEKHTLYTICNSSLFLNLNFVFLIRLVMQFLNEILILICV